MKKDQMRQLVQDLKDRQKWYLPRSKRENRRFDGFWTAWIKPSLEILEKELSK